MPFPVAAILPVLKGLGAALGIGSSAYSLGTTIKDRVERKKAVKATKKGLAPAGSSGSGKRGGAGVAGTGAGGGKGGFTPSEQPGNWWSGSPAGVETFNMYTPEQQAAMNSVLQNALGKLGSSDFDFDPIERQARQGFAEKTLPGIAERFTAMGAQRSSAFGNELGAAGAGLEGELAGMKQNYNLQQQAMLHNLLGIGLKPQFESLYRPGQEGLNSQLGKLLGSLAGNNADGLGTALQSLRDWLHKGGGDQGGGAAGDAGLDDIGFNPPPQNPTSLGGSMATLYNPSNVVKGVKAPNPMSAPTVNASGKVSSMAALKGLYGI